MHSSAINRERYANHFADEVSSDAAPLIRPEGFREYDARWWYGFAGSDRAAEINPAGVQAVGSGLAHMLRQRGADPAIIVGHDLRSYSFEVKTALVKGLISGGAQVYDIGLALSPMAYYAQFALNIQSVAMVTASHNENGWTGLKMGCARPYTFGQENMAELKAIVLEAEAKPAQGGTYHAIDNMEKLYSAALTKGRFLKRRLKVAVVCGNGTAGLFAPQILSRIGCDVVAVDCSPDWNFPHYNPDPEAAPMQNAMVEAVKTYGADLAFGFDGDGDRCGVVDNEGNIIFADRIGLLLAREFSQKHRGAHFIVDVKSSGLFGSDPVLQANQATVEYWKTGHSYIKHRMGVSNALAGFEKSGHVFLNQPLGLGYDDGLATAVAICEMLAAHPHQTLAELHRQLPVSFATPTLNVHCCDRKKYEIVAQIQENLAALVNAGGSFAGQAVADLLTINGVRITLADGTWGLIRASSNKPELVVVVESPVSLEKRNAMLTALENILQSFGVGELTGNRD
ncbi:phosphomannomutase/phosphoglucomutase [Pseudochrobactrum sp. sp1633]|uniref:phosphomannomutase/phosphoglucomutase n=1 Tax=Pseudochrobactrum sp. sp1633 TaxID=3036706 RepID=UPI0025A60365|nr:phosphomannomutase/phosphoglucomutase [Pseudochrobactrum sp. sp1633]MDM8344353.1 phosphomannomutase/phosphoglucomutase [Pseudochrobactrum sp. sp1633]HWD14515.1 phosphomannomutase/phosphoglucomutase [Pseudochrobactrum sp.]